MNSLTSEKLNCNNSHQISIVVPMYNEIDNVKPLLDAVQSALSDYEYPWELIVVDDGSTDGTARALVNYAKLIGDHVLIISLSRNFQQTAAMQAGIDAARGDIIVTMDGDLQNDPKDIKSLVKKLIDEDLDLVAGWRENRQDKFFLRRLPSLIANRVIRKVSGLAFHDLGCSLKVFRSSVLRKVRLYGEMHRFIPAWLATVTSPSRMAEMPVQHHHRQLGESKYGLSRTFRVIIDLLAVYFFLKFGSRPGHFFGGIGLAIGSIGISILGYLMLLKFNGEQVGGRPLLWLGFFSVLASLQFLTTGILAELMMRIYFDGGHAKPYHMSVSHQRAPDGQWHAI